jgi:predicted RNase H-like nuclease (RuvC/YqgF family)
MKSLFAEHYIDVPQEKVDVIEALAEKVETLEAALDESINENVELKRTMAEVEKEDILESLCDGLALSQVEKFKALAEGVEFDGDLETYGKKLAFVKESYFGAKKPVVSTNIEEETFEGETSSTTVSIDPSVNRYVEAINRNLKK